MILFHEKEVWLENDGDLMMVVDGFSRAQFLEGVGQEDLRPSETLISGDWVELFGEKKDNIFNIDRVHLLSPNTIDLGHGLEINSNVRTWSQFLVAVRAFFQIRGFDELQTPTLVSCPGTEPFLDAFKTTFYLGQRTNNYYLPTSPEIHLKKCLAKGWRRIFEIRPCFRNGELSPLHQPEFIMLEWYRTFATIDDIKSDVRALVHQLQPQSSQGHWVQKSVSDLFKDFLNFDLKPDSQKEDLEELAQSLGIDTRTCIDFDEVFFLIFVDKIEPNLKKYEFLFLHSYPPSQAALARLTEEGWGDRFEFYIRGVEIANAFNELNDPALQRKRALEDLQKKQLYGKELVPLDEEFFRSLDRGMPPSCGIALGLERLFMATHNLQDLSEFRLFPVVQPESKA